MDRRRFLGLLAAGTGAVALGACSSGSEASDEAGGGSRQTTSTTAKAKVPDDPGFVGDPFTLGVASGDPLASSVILWTRLAPKPADPASGFGVGDRDAAVLWEVATDRSFDHVVASGVEPALAKYGHSVHVDAKGLKPDTWYHYRFRIGGHTSPVGRTRTTPAERAEVDTLRLAFVSCQLRFAGHWTAYDHVADDDLDLVFHLGDYIYEYPGGTGPLGTPLTAEPQTLADYRVLYAAYKGDAKLQKAHLGVPWVVTWDDHEVENNYASEVPEKDGDPAAFVGRRKAAYQAFWEHQPVRIDPPAADGSLDVYRSFSYGSLATFFVLDGRQHRTDQVCGDKIPTVAASCPELADDAHTMLGTKQERWLSKGFEQVDTTWTVLAQQTVMKALVLGDLVLNVDQWDGYPAARRRLLRSIQEAKLENVMVLTGDIHSAGAADLRLSTSDAGPEGGSGGTDGKVVAHELVGTSISSPGAGAVLKNLDLSGLGLAYTNFFDHGYCRSTITADKWVNEFVVVETIAAETSAAKVDATVEITAGNPGMRVV